LLPTIPSVLSDEKEYVGEDNVRSSYEHEEVFLTL